MQCVLWRAMATPISFVIISREGFVWGLPRFWLCLAPHPDPRSRDRCLGYRRLAVLTPGCYGIYTWFRRQLPYAASPSQNICHPEDKVCAQVGIVDSHTLGSYGEHSIFWPHIWETFTSKSEIHGFCMHQSGRSRESEEERPVLCFYNYAALPKIAGTIQKVCEE